MRVRDSSPEKEELLLLGHELDQWFSDDKGGEAILRDGSSSHGWMER